MLPEIRGALTGRTLARDRRNYLVGSSRMLESRAIPVGDRPPAIRARDRSPRPEARGRSVA
jgi:hypothetical protein